VNRALVFVMVLAVGVVFLIAQGQHNESEIASEASAMLPYALDSLYPPVAKSPVYLEEMVSLSNSFAAIMIDFQANDNANAMKHFEEFKAKYEKCSELVPEWKNKYSTEHVNALGEALKSGTPEAVMRSYELVGANCHSCHLQYMSDVQYKYHWPDFADFIITDPILKKDLSYARFMMFIVTSMIGIEVDLQEGQIENARNHLSRFASRFETLTESCELCHADQRHHFVDNSMQEVLLSLQEAFEAEPIDIQLLRTSLQTLGTESCYKCHLVHIPPTYAKARWRPAGPH